MAEPKAYHRKFRNFLLNPGFQIKLLSYFVGLFLLTTLSMYGTSYLFFWRLKQKALNVGIPQGHVFFRFLDGQKFDLDLIFLLLTALNLILLIGMGIFISHRIAGPMYKLKNYLKEIGPGSPDFKLRSNDFFQDMEEVVNDLKGKIK